MRTLSNPVSPLGYLLNHPIGCLIYLCSLYVITYMSRTMLTAYAAITLALHFPYDAGFALLPFLFPKDEITVVSPR